MSETGNPGPPPRRERPPEEPITTRLWWYRDVRETPVFVRQPRPAWLRRERTLDAIACLALAVLWFSRARAETLFLSDWDFYNRVPLNSPTLSALLLNILTVTGVGFLVARVVRRTRRLAWRRLGAVAAVAALLVGLNCARLAHESLSRWTDVIGLPGLLVLAAFGLALSAGWPRHALWTVRRAGLVLSPLGVFTLAQALWMFLEVAAGPTWRVADPGLLKRGAPSLRRVVWIVFGALDQRITFEARPAGLELPELDRLRRESVYADAARPPGGTLDLSMPALVTGRPVVSVALTTPNDLDLTFADGRTEPWSKHPTVFSRARALGYDGALIGWYLPYPRVLGATLGTADWRASVDHEQARGTTVSEALQNQWEALVPPVHARRLLAQRLVELGHVALRAATDERFGLVLIHLPVPRPPGIYDRGAARVTAWNFSEADAAYVDNLALVDRTLGALRVGLERTRLEDRTWVVVSSDQSWTSSAQPDRPVDHRVPFLVRPPGGGRTRHVDVAFNTVATQDLVLAILRGSISDGTEAVAWLTRQTTTSPKGYTPTGRPIY